MKRNFRFEFNFSKNQLSIYCTFNVFRHNSYLRKEIQIRQFKVFKYVFAKFIKYRWTSLYAIDREQKFFLTYNEFAYKKIKNDCKRGGGYVLEKWSICNHSYINSKIKRPHITRSTCSKMLVSIS